MSDGQKTRCYKASSYLSLKGSVQCNSFFKFKAPFGSNLRATKNELFLRKFIKRFPILLISSNLGF